MSSKDSVQSMRNDVKDFIILSATSRGNSIYFPVKWMFAWSHNDAFKSPQWVKTKCDDEWD